jgi:predicted ribosome quality control (RQC) complex YloA/Tae2 family protein
VPADRLHTVRSSTILLVMHVDFLTLACLRDSLDGLLGARVQHIVLTDDLSVGLELYDHQRRYLTLSAHAQHARVLLVDERLRRGRAAESPLLLLLRKWVRGARLLDIVQPAWERVLVFCFEGAEGHCRLVAEIMDRYSNLVLIGPDGRVLDAAKRIGPELNRQRVTLPGHPYQVPPPPVNRRPPLEVDWVQLLADAPPDQPLHYLLTARLMGVSPTLARETATRATGDPAALVSVAQPGTVAHALRELLAPLDSGMWEPHVGLDDQGHVVAFAPYRLRQYRHSEPAVDISAAMVQFFTERTSADTYAAARREVQAAVDAAVRRIGQASAQVDTQLPDDRDIEQLRENGELLLAYQFQISAGSDRATVPDHRGEMCEIRLDAELSPLENAQALFRRYAKARRAANELPARIAELSAHAAYLEQLSADLAQAKSRPEIDAVRDALAAAGWLAAPRQRGAPVGGPIRTVVAGFTVYVGRNAAQNEEITFKHAAPDDLWLHARGQPGPHIIIKAGGREVPEQVIEHAAGLAARCAGAQPTGAGRLAVDVTQRRFVRRMPGGHPGMVTYRNERTLWVAPCPAS